MKIEIYKKGNIHPAEVWEDYPIVPNISDRIKLEGHCLSIEVIYRVLARDCIKLTIKD